MVISFRNPAAPRSERQIFSLYTEPPLSPTGRLEIIDDHPAAKAVETGQVVTRT
jgi:hypothetical protein